MALVRTAVLSLAAAAAALLLLPVSPAAASSGSCSRAVLADWSDGRIDREYPAACYREALRLLPDDLRVYGTAQTDIYRALMSAVGGSPTASAPAAAAAAPASAGWPWWLVVAVVSGALAGLFALLSLRAARFRRRS
jgi:hypothetical protein